MTETPVSNAQLLVDLADNTTFDITPEVMRRFLNSVHSVRGQLYTFGRVVANAMTTAYAKLDVFENEKNSNFVTASVANSNMIIQVPGLYFIEGTFSVNTDATQTIRCTLFKDNVEQQNLTWMRSLTLGFDVLDANFSGFLDCPNGNEVLDVQAKTVAGTANIIASECNLTILKVA